MIFAVHQPNYAPWCGYFAKMSHVDAFVFLDDAQMPLGRSYVSRTRVMAGDEPRWLSVPVRRRAGERISDVRFAEEGWQRKHVRTLEVSYAQAPGYRYAWDALEPVYSDPGPSLCEFNIRLITVAAKLAGVRRPDLLRASELGVAGKADERIVVIGDLLGADCYLSGAGGKAYQDPQLFERAGIELRVAEYSPIPYDRGGLPFEPGLSILDALFHRGSAASELLTYEPGA